MKKEKIFFLAGVLWELFRFLFFFLLIAFIFFNNFVWNTHTILWLLFLSSCQLLMPAGYALLIFDSIRFYVVIQLLRIGKILSLFPGIFILIDELLLGKSLFSLPLTTYSLLKKAVFFLLSISIFFDLIFLYFLLSYKEKGKEIAETHGESSHLPDYRITEIKDDFHTENKGDDVSEDK
jgi:hypothetical protein